VESDVRQIGPERRLFAWDGSPSDGVGKIRGEKISDEAKQRIWGENFLRLVGRA